MSSLGSIEQEIDVIDNRLDNIEIGVNTFFILIFCIIIFFMKAGFSLLEAGSVRAKNTTNILMKNIIDTASSSFIFWATGYAFCFGSSGNGFIGVTKFFLINTPAKEYPMFFYNLVYASASGTIVSGALAERCLMLGYLVYSTFMTGFIYPVVAHWVFNPAGWLYSLGFHDKSGSCVIHVVGGTASLIGAVILGPRLGRFGKNGKVNSIPGHSTVLTTLGFFILWFGFLAFNGVSEKGIVGPDHNHDVPPRAIIATVLGGTGALLSSLIVSKVSITKQEIRVFKKEFKFINVFGGYWSLGASINGSLAGTISVCAGCDTYEPWAAFVIGLISGVLYCVGARVTMLMRVDDPVNAFPLHYWGGAWGTIAVGLFAHPDRLVKWPDGGVLYSWSRSSFKLLGVQLLGCVVVTGWVMVLSVLLFLSLRLFFMLRVSKAAEKEGLDYVNGEPAYPIDAALLRGNSMSYDNDDDDDDDDEDDLDDVLDPSS